MRSTKNMFLAGCILFVLTMVFYVAFDLVTYFAQLFIDPFYVSLVYVWFAGIPLAYVITKGRLESKAAEVTASIFLALLLALVCTGFLIGITLQVHGHELL